MNVLQIIEQNPYRILGVYSTSPKKEIVANLGRMKAFLKVGRTCEFPLDLPTLLPPIVRTEESVSEANARLTLPQDQLKYAQFWFVKGTSLDDIAFNHLFSGNTEQAIEIWAKKDSASSLQNRIVCALTKENYGTAIQCAEKLYTEFSNELVAMVLGENTIIFSINLYETFLDVLMEKLLPTRLSGLISLPQWKEYVAKKGTRPLIDSILAAVEAAKASKGQGPKARFDAGTKLMNDTKSQLAQLKSLLQTSDLEYQMVADKLGLAILQCGIDYYNDSGDDDAAYKAMKLQKYAYGIVVGQMAKERCKENVDILEKIISELPPLDVLEEDKAIQAQLIVFQLQSKNIEMSIGFIKRCAPLLVAVKTKLGKTNDYYLRISTLVANSALSNLIEEVNAAQKNEDIPTLIKVLIEAWRATLYIDKLDKTNEYASGRYHECRDALYNIVFRLKGFERPSIGYRYQYGCGWALGLNANDLDMRTDNETFEECDSISGCNTYIENFPQGIHIEEVKARLENLTFRNCKTIDSYRKFILKYPNSKYKAKAELEIAKYEKEEEERKAREEEIQKKINEIELRINACSSINEIIDIFRNVDTKLVPDYNEKCSLKAFDLSSTEDDYKRILSVFGEHSAGGLQVRIKIDRIERLRLEAENKKITKRRWILAITILFILCFIINAIWGIKGFIVICGIIAFIAYFVAIGVIQSNNSKGCIISFIAVTIAIIFGSSAVVLREWFDRTENERNSLELFEKIKEAPNIELFNEYMRKYNHTNKVDEVRLLWLNYLIEKSRTFDYGIDKTDLMDSSMSKQNSPIQELQEFIIENEKVLGASLCAKTQTQIDLICDSLYAVASNTKTVAAWKQYQKNVPIGYYKDSNVKIEDIENQSWNTENKAWEQATLENTIASYRKYQNLYPKGVHYVMAEKKLIDLEVSNIYAGDHGELPEMDKVGYGNGSTSIVEIDNSTSYTMTILYSGPDSKRLVISPHSSGTLRLTNGTYRVAASVSSGSVRSYAGMESLTGGTYSASYYISTSRIRF